jgi:uncharacterized oxidoreductase
VVNGSSFCPKQMMELKKIIDATIKGMKSESFEIYPGIARVLLIMSRIAPGFILKMLSKSGANEMAG